MSDLVFPVLPLVDREASSSPGYATETHRSVSGKRVAVSWRSSSIDGIRFRVTLREWVNAPVGTWGTISERALWRYFVDTHRGSWDSWLLDNSTGVYQKGGATQPRVLFRSDDPEIKQLGPGLFVADFDLEAVP